MHQLAADLGSDPVELEQWPAAGGSGTVNRAQRLADLGKNPGRFPSYTIDQLHGTLAAA